MRKRPRKARRRLGASRSKGLFGSPVVFIEWEDSCTTQGWGQPEKDETSLIRSAGILVSQTKKAVTISSSKSQGGRYVDQLAIPRSCIQKMVRL